MTEANETIEVMKAHKDEMERMAVRYIGKEALALGRNMPSPWHKKLWYINHIADIAKTEGRYKECKTRCRGSDSISRGVYGRIIREAVCVRELLSSELMTIP